MDGTLLRGVILILVGILMESLVGALCDFSGFSTRLATPGGSKTVIHHVAFLSALMNSGSEGGIPRVRACSIDRRRKNTGPGSP
jgi:hypothetical protein